MELGADLESTKGIFAQAKAQELQQEQGSQVLCAFHLPGGAVDKMSFAAGVTVAYVKLALEKAHSIPMAKQILRMGGRTLIDPLSLVDVGIAAGSGATIEVTVAQ